ncbi:hypothetical protein GGH99_000355 [Coemansia sp. RSA 1285]|nr:hypothetical protein GGH99_000355 [Coemansia sp. RSA 1285]
MLQTSCMIALVNEAFGFVSASCLTAAGETSVKATGRLKIVINGLESSGQLSVGAAVVHPLYNATTLANNIGLLYFNLDNQGKAGSDNSVASAKSDVTKTLLLRRTLATMSPPTWNKPPSIVSFASNSNSVCDIGSPVYSVNKADFICNNAEILPGSGLASCPLPLALGYTTVTSSSVMPSAVYSHSVVFGDGLCSNNKKVHYYVAINNYLAWGTRVVETLKRNGMSAKTNQIAADYSMKPPNVIVPVIKTYSGDLYTQIPAAMNSPSQGSPDSGSDSSGSPTATSGHSYTTYYYTTTSCESDDSGDPGNGNPNSVATGSPTPSNNDDGSSGSASNAGNGNTSQDKTNDNTGDDTDASGSENDGSEDCNDNECNKSDGANSDENLSDIVNIRTMYQSGQGNVYIFTGNNDPGTVTIGSNTEYGFTATTDGSDNDSNSDSGTGSNSDTTDDTTNDTTNDTTDDTTDDTADESESELSDEHTDSAAGSEEKESSGGISRTSAILIAVLVPVSVLVIFAYLAMKLASNVIFFCTLGLVTLFAASNANAAFTVTQAQLDKAAPDRVGTGSCASSECATNPRALVSINKAIAKYGITRKSEVVAMIALMAFESSDWLYNINHTPGVPGQGTRAMISPEYVAQYAQLLHPDQAPKAVSVVDKLQLVLNDDDSFGSAFWFLTAKAPQYHNNDSRLRAGNIADFKDYVVTGLNGGWESRREDVWNRVNTAFN